MNAILLLFLVGVVLLAGEIFTPGLVLGALGALAMIAGCGLAFSQFGAAAGGLATLAALLLLGLTLYLELVWLPKTRLGKKLVVHSTVSSTSQPMPAEAEKVMGKAAEAVTTLAPSGYVSVEGRRYEAFCQDGHADKGAALRVVGLDNFRLIVTKP
jgi:membrane-bound ClpP family serine protease